MPIPFGHILFPSEYIAVILQYQIAITGAILIIKIKKYEKTRINI